MTPRILVLDIETSPHLVYTWGLWQQNISIDQIVEPGTILCWSAKWHGEKGTRFGWNDTADLAELHSLLTEADAVCHYNGDSFDLPWINGVFEQEGFDPVPEVVSIDLLKTVRKLRLASNKLDWAAATLLGQRKVQTGGFKLWLGVMAGDEKAMRKMERYNRADVVLTDRLLSRLMPRIKNLPNVSNPHGEDVVCPRTDCGSSHVQRRGVSRTRSGEYPRYQCQKCRGWFKSTRRESGHGVVAI